MQNDLAPIMETHWRTKFCAACMSFAALLVGTSACVDPPGGASDVPCIVVPEWISVPIIFKEQGNALLITDSSPKDIHEVILRFDSVSASFSAVTQAEWDQSEGTIENCCLIVFEEGGFSQLGSELAFNGIPVQVAGGTTVGMSPTVGGNLIAVLSTNGRLLPFNGSTGQHYHQVFSVETGERIGGALKLGIGDKDGGGVNFDWAGNNNYVAYFETVNLIDPTGTRICVVHVGDLSGDR